MCGTAVALPLPVSCCPPPKGTAPAPHFCLSALLISRRYSSLPGGRRQRLTCSQVVGRVGVGVMQGRLQGQVWGQVWGAGAGASGSPATQPCLPPPLV